MEQAVVKKKHHVGLWVTFIIIFILIILPIALVFAFFFDPTHTPSEDLGVETKGAKSDMFSTMLIDMFDYTDDASKKNSLRLSIKEEEINQVLFDNLLSTLDENTKSFLPQAYVKIEKDKYVFVAEINAYGFFKTRLFLETQLTQQDNPKGLMFELTNIKIARLGGLQGLTFSLLGNYINDNQLNAMLKDSIPLSIESHLFDKSGKHYLFYPHESFVKDMNGMMDIGGDVEFFTDFIIDMVEDRKFSFDFYSDKSVNGLVSLQDFHDNPNYCSYNDYVIDFKAKDELNKYLPALLKSSDVTRENADTVAKFISYGYSQLSEDEKTLVDGITNLPTVLGKSVADYSAERAAKFATKGKSLGEVEPIIDIVSNQVSEALTPERILEIVAAREGKVVDAKVSEVELHDVLKTNHAVGYGKVMYSQNKDGSYKIAYLSVDNIYVNIVNNNIYFIIGININGYEVTMILSSILETGGKGKLYFRLDGENTYFGSTKISVPLFNSFTNLLGSAIQGNEWLSFDKTNKRFVLDFSKAINDNEKIQFLKTNGLDIDIGVSAIGSNISDKGYINISVNASSDA